MRRALPTLFFTGLLLFLSGCTKTKVDGSTLKVTYEAWVGIASLAVGIAATAFAWFAKKDGGIRAWVFFIVASAGTVFFAPFAFFDHVTVSEEKLSTQWGFWAFPTKHEFKFDDVQQVTLEKKTRRTRRGRRTSYDLNFQLRNGTSESLSATNSLMEEASDALVNQLERRNIHVIDRTGE